MHLIATRLSHVVIVGLFLLAGCSSADDSTASTTTASTTAASTTATLPTATAAVPVEDTTTTVDTRTDEEIAIDRLDLMMFDLGITDLEGRANCVIERMESENIEVTGEGTSELIAIFGCDENAITRWLPAANPALAPEVWSCTVESIRDWINELTIPEAEAFFEVSQPPAEFIDLTATRCDVSADELVAAF